MDNALVALSDELASAVERAAGGIVTVHGRSRLSSSGVLWSRGVIVTAEHTLKRDDGIRVTLPDGRSVGAELAGRDPGTDLAVLKIEEEGSRVARAGETNGPKAGDLVLAVGRSRDTGVSAALGIVSSVSGPWHTWRGGRVDQFIRLDLGLYPGSSGGAAVNARGELIGILTSGLSRTSALAIPVSTIERTIQELLNKGYVGRGYLGVGLQPVALPEHLISKLKLPDARALIVLSVEESAPSGKGGLTIGDILVAFDGKSVGDTDDVQSVLGAESVGKSVRASIVRGGELQELSIVIGERPRGRT